MTAIKPPGKRINRITRNIGVVPAAPIPPRMPRGLCKAAQDAWASYFADAVSGVLRPPDNTIVVRWAKNLDRYYRLLAEADAEPITAGSTGQPKANPLYDQCLKLETSIRADEQQIGCGPLNRLRLGVALSESSRSLAQLNAEAEAGGAVDDPRVALLADRRGQKQ